MDVARDGPLPAGIRAFAYASYLISIAVLGGGYLLWQTACVPPSDDQLTKILERKRADFEALRDLALEDHQRAGMYVMWRDGIGVKFRQAEDRAMITRTSSDLPAERAKRYRALLVSTQLRMLKVHNSGTVEFELWGWGLPPDVWH